MSKPELDIIRSPEAEIFLQSVTKGFYDRSYTGLWLFEVIGQEWDELRAWSEGMRDEIHPQTCTWSIAIWEWLYGIKADESLTLQERRQRILSKIIGQRPVNPEVIRRGLEALTGVKTEVTSTAGPYRFGITLYPGETFLSYERVFQYIHTIKPAHLSVWTAAAYPAIIFMHKNDLHWLNLRIPLRISNFAGNRLDGRRALDGTWMLDQYLHGVKFQTFAVNLRCQQSYSMSGTLTKNRMWRLDGQNRLNGSRQLNTSVTKEAI